MPKTITLLLHWIIAAASLADEHHEHPLSLQAYDCDDLRNLRDVSYSRGDTCLEKQGVTTIENITMQILQQTSHHRVNGYSCSLTMTRSVQYCGAYDHMTTFNKANLIGVPKRISITECRDIIATNTWMTPAGKQIRIENNQIAQYNYEGPGHTYVSDAGEVKCMGQDWSFN